MSKIYEALLRAEKDRSSGNIPPASPSDAPQPVQAISATALAEMPVEVPADLPAQPWPQPGLTAADAILAPEPAAALTGAPASPATTPDTPNRRVRASIVSDPTPPAAAAPAPAAPAVAVPNRRKTDRPVGALDLSKVKPLPWKPSVYHLPALEERGRSVEQFRSLRSRMHEFRDLNTLKSILVSSGLPQEGKTFIAANLAVAFARHKSSRVLLIDGDMRRSSLHQILGTTSEPGLAEYLAGNADAVDIMQTPSAASTPAAQGLSSLTFIGAGKDTNTAADLSGNYRFDDLIEAVSPLFDWIVVDSSPVNLVADGVNLARACDGVLLVARAGATKFEVAQRALVELKASTILGFVLNAVPKPPSSGGYYGYDNYDSYDTYDALEKTEA